MSVYIRFVLVQFILFTELNTPGMQEGQTREDICVLVFGAACEQWALQSKDKCVICLQKKIWASVKSMPRKARLSFSVVPDSVSENRIARREVVLQSSATPYPRFPTADPNTDPLTVLHQMWLSKKICVEQRTMYQEEFLRAASDDVSTDIVHVLRESAATSLSLEGGGNSWKTGTEVKKWQRRAVELGT